MKIIQIKIIEYLRQEKQDMRVSNKILILTKCSRKKQKMILANPTTVKISNHAFLKNPN